MRIIILFLVLSGLVNSGAFAQGTVLGKGTESVSPTTMGTALEFVMTKMQAVAIVDSSRASAIEQARLRARKQIRSPLTVDEFAFVLGQFLTAFRDAHSQIINKTEHRVLPIALAWLQQGLFVTKDEGKLKRGDRVLKMGTTDVAEVARQVSKITPAENRFFVRGVAPEILVREDFLRHLGALQEQEPNQIAVDVQRGAQRIGLTLQLQSPAKPSAEANWFRLTIDAANSVAIVAIDRCDYSQGFASALGALMQEVQERGVKKLVIDLRANHGGDALVAFAVANYLSNDYRSFAVRVRKSDELLNQSPEFAQVFTEAFQVPGRPDLFDLPSEFIKKAMQMRLGSQAEIDPPTKFHGQAFLLTSNFTFSSANLFATLFKDNHLATLVGEPTGNEINFHGQMLTLDLPDLPLQLTLSSSRNSRPDVQQKNSTTLRPDVQIPFAAKDVREGRDPQFAYVLRQ